MIRDEGRAPAVWLRLDAPWIDTGAQTTIQHVEGHESLSQLFTYSVAFACKGADIPAKAALGGPMRIQVGNDGGMRYFGGLVTEFRSRRLDARTRRYDAVLRPTLWLATQSRRYRVFQDQTVRTILTEVFQAYGVRTQWRIHRPLPSLPYCVQYGESDFDFVSRLMERTGLHYLFCHQADGHLLTIGDAATPHVPIDASEHVLYRPAHAPWEEAIFHWEQRHHWPMPSIDLIDYNFETASTRAAGIRRVTASEPTADASVPKPVWQAYPGGFTDRSTGEMLADQHRGARATVASSIHGTANLARFQAGRCFSVEGHPDDPENGSYLLVSVHYTIDPTVAHGHRGVTCQFEAIRADVPFRAPLITPPPMIRGPQTALVVGPEKDQICTDEHGRIKVRFHWDTSDQTFDACSCWIRVAQPVAGPRWGAQFIPRVGQEVVVQFLDGNPDRPLITGCLYNAASRPTHDLPANASRSGFRSQSFGNEGTFNEIAFDDHADKEGLFLHAGRDQFTTVVRDAMEKIGNEHHHVVDKGAFVRIGGDLNRDIGGRQATRVADSLHQAVQGGRIDRIGADWHSQVGGDRIAKITGSAFAQCGGDAHVTVTQGIALSSGGDVDATAAQSLSLAAGSSLTLRVGASAIVLTPEAVTIQGPTLHIEGELMVSINGGGGTPGTIPKAAQTRAFVDPCAPHAARVCVDGHES